LKIKQIVVLLAIVLAASSVSFADTFDFSYFGGGYVASGVFTTGNSGSPYTVTGITGTADGFAITGLSPYAGADQKLYVPPASGYYGDYGGISFATLAGVDYNITSYPSGNSNFINISTLDPGGNGCCGVAIDMSVSQVPDGGVTLMLLGGALVGLETLRPRFRV
jgi:hypothetical protein